MQFFINLLANVPLKTKIFGVSFIFLAGMVLTVVIGGIALVKQNDVLEQAISLASSRVTAASAAKISITL